MGIRSSHETKQKKKTFIREREMKGAGPKIRGPHPEIIDQIKIKIKILTSG
jgi:hypothetical protein